MRGARAAAPGAQQVDVWVLRVPSRGSLDSWAEVLSADERERAGGFSFAGDQRRYVWTRAMLRQILGGCLGARPHSLEFEYGPHGRPELVGRPLRFSVSHCGSVALVAVARSADVGADVEAVRASTDWRRMAERWYAPAERALLERSPERLRRRVFFELWTRKEALLKAKGVGITVELSEVDSLHPPPGWTVQALAVGRAARAAVAVALERPTGRRR